MTEYRVGEDGATVFDPEGRLLAQLPPGAVVVPGPRDANLAPRELDQEHPTRGPGPCTPGYADKMLRPGRGPRS